MVERKNKALARLVTQKSIVLLKTRRAVAANKTTTKSIAVIGPRGNEVYLDWYSGTPPYRVTPVEGIKNAVGSSVKFGSLRTMIMMQP